MVLRQNASLSSANQIARPPGFGGKWGTECLNTRFPSAYPDVYGIQHEAYGIGKHRIFHCEDQYVNKVLQEITIV